MTQAEYNRIYWACRRGMLELDLLLLPFWEQHSIHLNEQQRAQFARLLTYPDPELHAWLQGVTECPYKDYHELIRMIQSHAKTCNHSQTF